MKTLRLLFLLLVPLCLSFAANAQGIYGVNITASLGTQLVTPTSSGTTYSLHNVPVTDKTITEALFATGTTGAAKATDLAVVFSDGEIAVINTGSNNAYVATIAETGTNSSDYSYNYTGKVKTGESSGSVTLTEVESDFEFTIPGQPLQTTNVRLSAKYHIPSDTLAGLFMTFMGGGSISGTDTYFQGSVRQTGKVY